MKCPLCDFENEEGSKFCKNCNAPLSKQDYSEENPYINKKMKALKINNIIKLILIILVVLFAVYVWPTPYKNMPYYGGKIPFRIHRITGKGELWYERTGWSETK